jgi:hypothetical protein
MPIDSNGRYAFLFVRLTSADHRVILSLGSGGEMVYTVRKQDSAQRIHHPKITSI